MTSDKRDEHFTRKRILMALSDEEIARVGNAETLARLPDGDEYLDLQHLELGVQFAGTDAPPQGRVLPKRAVHEATWSKLLKRLSTRAG